MPSYPFFGYRRDMTTPGEQFRKALTEERPLQLVGVPNAYCALMAEVVGFRALYLSGAGVANLSYGVPDTGITTLEQVLMDVERITSATTLPLLVDGDTGWDDPSTTVSRLIGAGAAGVHLEDQVEAKKCGHLEGKQLVSTEEMLERVSAAVVGKKEDPSFIIMARTDAFALEGLEGVIVRGLAYRDAGAEMLFAEALPSLEAFCKVRAAVGIPLLANLTEFGKTPYLSKEELKESGIDMALYPLTVSRLMHKAAFTGLKTLRKEGSQESLVEKMQTRQELYHFLKYKEK